MKLSAMGISLVVLLFGGLSLAANEKLNSEEALRIGVENDDLYFIPLDRENPLSWSGTIYDYRSKSCFIVKHNLETHKVEAQPIKCSPAVLEVSTETYEKISDFDTFKKKFLACLQERKISCLRRLTSRSVQISFGVDGMGDRRPLLYPKWKKKDFDEIITLLEKGVSPSGDEREFPYPQANEYIGMRGSFKNKNGGWLLAHYLGGD